MEARIRSATPEDGAQLASIPSAFRFAANRFLIALEDGQIAAYLAWRRVAPDELEILHLETLTPFRRRGLARRLVRELKKQELGAVFLEVRESNQAARQLYDSEGFELIGKRVQYYVDSGESGIVLKFHPC